VDIAAKLAAGDAGGHAAVTHSATVQLTTLFRNGTPVQAAPAGAQFPLSATAMEPWAATALYGTEVGDALANGFTVMSRPSADLRGAQRWDVVRLRRAAGGTADFFVGAFLPEDRAPSELLMSFATAGAIGFSRPASVVLFGFRSTDEIDAALAARGLVRPGVRISRSWSRLRNPDSTLGLARTKQLLGEFWYRSLPLGLVSVDPAWSAANIQRTTFPLGVTASCHRVIVPALQGAFAEIQASGLGGAIDVANTNRYGGCYGPREIRPAGGTTGGSLSRHTWAMALDLNTTQNPLGGVPRLDCRVVFIFRKWGFAWGGNFTTPDGMHFEYVGEDRSQIWNPNVAYCPNPVPEPPPPSTTTTTTTTLPEPSTSQERRNENRESVSTPETTPATPPAATTPPGTTASSTTPSTPPTTPTTSRRGTATTAPPGTGSTPTTPAPTSTAPNG
jgi:hypothetical protein